MNDTLNNSFETDLGKYNHEDLIILLQSDNIKEKHLAALELEKICSKKDAQILVSNLVGQDGKVREAVAFKINELNANPDFIDFFIDEKIFAIIFEGIMDINGNVCRQIVGSKLFENKEFRNYLCKRLPESISKILEDIAKIDANAKQYIVSKRNFQLYWCLEALYHIVEDIEFKKIKNIMQRTAEFYDYTIREKTAKILTKLDNIEVKGLKEKLKNDENYYVRRYLEVAG